MQYKDDQEKLYVYAKKTNQFGRYAFYAFTTLLILVPILKILRENRLIGSQDAIITVGLLMLTTLFMLWEATKYADIRMKDNFINTLARFLMLLPAILLMAMFLYPAILVGLPFNKNMRKYIFQGKDYYGFATPPYKLRGIDE